MRGCCGGCLTIWVFAVAGALLVGGWVESNLPERAAEIAIVIVGFALIYWVRTRYPRPGTPRP